MTMVRYYLAVIIWAFFTPWGLWQTLKQSVGQVLAAVRAYRQKPIEPANLVRLSLPFEGEWNVVNGGVEKNTSHSWEILAQRFAYDFLIFDEQGKTYREKLSRPDAYYCFDQPVLAAAEGVVIALRQDVRDAPNPGSGWIDLRTPDLRGNYVVLQHTPQQFTVYAHLRQSSVMVEIGQRVAQGTQLARCGNSGHSTEPHLHFQIQDNPDFFLACGIPAVFTGFSRQLPDQRAELINSGVITRPQKVKSTGWSAGGMDEVIPTARITLTDILLSVMNASLTVLGVGFVYSELVQFLIGLIFRQ